MTRRIISIALAFVLLAILATPALADKPTGFDDHGNATGQMGDNGFDQYGYNKTARIFSGTGMSWCMGKFGDETWCTGYLGPYAQDKLVMKWNAEWDRGDAEGWTGGSYDAWENNEWNGMVPGGSGEVWHYKIVWVGDCTADPTLVPEGGYCIWGQFAGIMDQGTSFGEHFWLAHAVPSGYGTYP